MQTNLFSQLARPAILPAAAPLAPAMRTELAEPATHVGRSWDTKEGRRTVLRYQQPEGAFTEGVFEVGTVGHTRHERVGSGSLERRIFVETSNYAGFLAAQQREQEQRQAALVEEELYQGFFATMPPLRAGKARAALEARAGFDGRVQRRKDFILAAVAQGAVTGQNSYGKVLEMPSGGFFSARQITQSAVDFAAHLLQRQAGA